MSKWPRPKYLTPQEIKELVENLNSKIFADFECKEDGKINISSLDNTGKDLTAPSVPISVKNDQLKVDTA